MNIEDTLAYKFLKECSDKGMDEFGIRRYAERELDIQGVIGVDSESISYVFSDQSEVEIDTDEMCMITIYLNGDDGQGYGLDDLGEMGLLEK